MKDQDVYPARFAPEPGGYSVSFRDVPEALTCGSSFRDALVMAEDALATALEFYDERGEARPKPSTALEGEFLIRC